MATADPYAGMDNSFSLQLHQLVSAVQQKGGNLSIASGKRDNAEQADLYARAVKRYGEANAGNWAAHPMDATHPGSNHERGLAADIHGDPRSLQLAHDMAGQFGLNFPLSNEAWHIEPVGIRQSHNNQGGPAAYYAKSGTPDPATGAPTEGETAINKLGAIFAHLSGETYTPDGVEPGTSQYGNVPAKLADNDMSKLGGSPYDNYFALAGQKYGISPKLLKAVAKQESGFNPNAGSSAGAKGLMQFMPGTAKGLGINPMDPAQAVDGAARLLSSYIKEFGSPEKALAAYNAGPGAVTKYGGIPPYRETQNYVHSIMGSL
jgi:hypothetical protein